MNEVVVERPKTEKRLIAHYYKDKNGVNQVALFCVSLIPGFPCNLNEVAKRCFDDEEYRKVHSIAG